MRSVSALFVVVLLLASCSQLAPTAANRTTDVQVQRVFPTNVVNDVNYIRELGVQVLVTNTTDRVIWIIGGVDWYMQTADMRLISSAYKSGQNNVSTCNREQVAPGGGVTCNLYFYFGNAVWTSDVFPANVRYSEPYGDSRGSATVSEYID